jgi:sugar phosphate isomerase/epimerase
MNYGISTLVVQDEDLEPGLQRIKNAGFNEIELLWEPSHFKASEHSTNAVYALMNQLDLSMRVGHSPIIDIDLASFDKEKRNASIEVIARSFTVFKELGAESVVVHVNGYSLDYSEENRSASASNSKESILALVDSASDAGIKMALGNLPHRGTSRPFHSMEELQALIMDMPREHVGLCLDTTHARFAGHDPLQQLNVAADRLFTLHLHDTDGDDDRHWVPGRGIIDWDAFIARLSELNFTGSRTLEVQSTLETSDSVLKASFSVAKNWESHYK